MKRNEFVGCDAIVVCPCTKMPVAKRRLELFHVLIAVTWRFFTCSCILLSIWHWIVCVVEQSVSRHRTLCNYCRIVDHSMLRCDCLAHNDLSQHTHDGTGANEHSTRLCASFLFEKQTNHFNQNRFFYCFSCIFIARFRHFRRCGDAAPPAVLPRWLSCRRRQIDAKRFPSSSNYWP